MASANRRDDGGGLAWLEARNADQIGVIEVVPRVVAHQVPGQPEVQGCEPRCAFGAHPADLTQWGLWADDLGRGGAARGGRRHDPQAGRGNRLDRLNSPLEFEEILPTAPHQALAAGLAQLPVAGKIAGQLPETGKALNIQLLRWGRQSPMEKRTKALLAPQQILKTAVSLELQGLLQRTQPGLDR